ncbi:MAG: response regulator [Thermodesulfobacteriota bacterium]|nr:response regulator [Thermodesulfobacteriota bacterium]
MADNKKTILIIDDDADYLFTMETFLTRNGFAVETADDGEKGLALAKEIQPGLILLDVMMKSLYSGFEVCRQLRSDPLYKGIPIIGISAMKDELGVQFEPASDAEYFNPDAFFDKPIDKDALLVKINDLIQAG